MRAGGLLVALLTGCAAPLPLVMVDAGHGGHDAGGVRGGLKEREIVQAHADALAGAVRARGGYVVLTGRGMRS